MTIFLLLTIAFLLLLLIFKYIRNYIIDLIVKLFGQITKLNQRLLTYRINQIENRLADNRLKKLSLLRAKEGGNPLSLKDLTPKDDADSDGHYAKLLNWALSKGDVRNIALSGPYGSGKSSILKTFQKRNKKHRFLNISLASFKEHVAKDTLEIDVILLSILQQIFYYVKAKKIPDSSFKRVRKFSKPNAALKAAGLTIYCACLIHVICPKWHTNLSLFSAWNYSHAVEISLACYVLLIAGTMVILYMIFRIYSNSKLSKLKISSAELEVVSNKETSVLNQHLDEILYFFEIAKYDVVIFEDLDRFDKKHNTEIFIKLRELNTLINNSRHRGKHVAFIYAIKDDVFVDEERTKFFDLIIPVIPVINTSNSADQLSILLKGLNLANNVTKEFINDIAVFIDDMRLLLNIINEFVIFQDNIGDFDPIPDNLLAIVVYKNVFPSEFADLYANKGRVFDFFNDKASFAVPLTATLVAEKQGLMEEIKAIEAQFTTSKHELRAIYIQEMFDTLPDSVGKVTFQYVSYSGKQLKSDDIFKLLQSEHNINYDYKTSYGSIASQSSNISFRMIEDQVNQEETYAEREAWLMLKSGNEQELKKKRLEELEGQIVAIETASAKTLSGIKPLSEIDPRLKDQDLLLYLIEKGYIDEQFRNYMNYFYPESISKQDREFILAVIYQKNVSYNFKLDQIVEVISQINTLDFAKPQLLNLTITNYLFEHPDEFIEKRNRLMLQIASGKTISTGFIKNYIEEGSVKGVFLAELAEYWPKLWDYLQIESNLPIETLHKYLKLLLYNASDEALEKLNTSKLLSNYIASMENFIEFSSDTPDAQRLQTTIKSLLVKFQKLAESNRENELLKFIYENNLYLFSPDFIEFWYKLYAEDPHEIENLKSKNYTTILNTNLTSLTLYIASDIAEYVSKVLLFIDTNTSESEDTFVKLMNTVENSNLLIRVMDKQNVQLSDISEVTDSILWSHLLQANSIIANWNNVTQYWSVNGFDQHLIYFLNKQETYRVLQRLLANDVNKLDSEQLLTFYKKLVEEDKIEYNAFVALIDGIAYQFSEIDFTAVSDIKTDVLIQKDKLQLTEENYSGLKTVYYKNIQLLERYRVTLP